MRKSNYMARYACRPIPPRPEGRGFSGFPVKIKVRIFVSLPMIDVRQVLKAISNVLSGCLSHVAIVVIIKTHVRVFDS